MKRALFISAALAGLAVGALIAIATGGGTAGGQSSPTPTPVPDPCEGVCLTGFWRNTYWNYTGETLGHCSYTITQSGASTLWAQGSCTGAWLGDASGSLNQLSLTWDAIVVFKIPLQTVQLHGIVSPDGKSDDGTWVCTAGCTDSGTYMGTRIEPHSEGVMPSSGALTVSTALKDELGVPEGALPSGTTVTVDFDTLPAAPPEGLVALSRAFVLGPEDPPLAYPATLVIHYTIEDLGGTADPETLRVYVYNSATSEWDFLGGTVDTVAQTLTVELPHLSLFAIMGSPQPLPTPTPTATATVIPTATPTSPVPPRAVGGISDLPALAGAPAGESAVPAEESGWSADAYAALAGVGAAAGVALALGGWYARRRWLT